MQRRSLFRVIAASGLAAALGTGAFAPAQAQEAENYDDRPHSRA